MRLLLSRLLPLLALVLAPTLAHAAELKVDLAPFLAIGREWLAVLAAVIGGVAAKFVASFVARVAGVYVDDKVRGLIDQAVRNGIVYAGNTLLEKGAGRSITLEMRNDLVALAASYVVERVPDALRRFQIDEAALEKLILGRLPISIEPVPVPAPGVA